jgi:hypothetical protein
VQQAEKNEIINIISQPELTFFSDVDFQSAAVERPNSFQNKSNQFRLYRIHIIANSLDPLRNY